MKAYGFRDDMPAGDPKRLVIVRTSSAGFLQAYVLDPDLLSLLENGCARRISGSGAGRLTLD